MKNYSYGGSFSASLSYQVLQDAKGYIWTCTNDGVVRYDGTNFKYYSKSNGFPDYGSFHMSIDKQNRIWFVTFSGKVCYFENNHFFVIHINKEDSTQAKWVSATKSGSVIITTSAGSIYEVDEKKHVKLLYKHNQCVFIIEPFDESTYIFTDGINYFELKNSVAKCLKVNAIRNDYPRIGVTAEGLVLSCKEGLILYTKSGARLIVPANEKIQPMSYFDEPDYLWIAHRHGLSKFSKKSSQYSILKHYSRGKLTTSVIKDNSNKIWYTGYYDGLYLLADERVIYYKAPLQKDGQNIFLSILDGPQSTFLINETGQIYEIKNRRLSFVCEIRKNNTKQLLFIHHAAINKDQYLLNVEGYVMGFSTVSKKITRPFKKAISNINLATYHYTNESFSYQLMLMPSLKHYLYKLSKDKEPSLVSTQRVAIENLSNLKAFAVDKNERIWLGNKDGLWYLKDSIPYPFAYKKKKIDTYVSYIFCDNRNKLWVCTMGDGIYCINTQNGELILHLTESNGLRSNICRKIIFDTENNAWVSNSEGLTKIEDIMNSRSIIHFSVNNLLPSNVILDFIESNASIFVSTTNGVIKFPYDLSSSTTKNQPTYITNISSTNSRDTFLNNSAVFRYGSSIQINFINIEYGKGEPVKYEYRLNTSEQRPWEVTTATSVKYEQLQPGEYEFQVRAAPSSLSDVPQVASIKIIVQPLYWQTWWFKALVIASFVLVFTLSTVAYFTVKNKETLSNKKLIESQLNSLRAQINPHFIFNSLNSIQDFILDQQPRMANLYLSRFASLMRMIVENSQKEFTTLGEEIDFLEMYLSLEKLRLNNDLDIHIDTDYHIDKTNVIIPTMLLQPLVENAIKHGLSPLPQNRKLSIRFGLKGNKQLLCTIEDNGVGRATREVRPTENSSKSSVGLQNIRERLDLLFPEMHQFFIHDLSDYSGKPQGTKVEIIIPVT